MTISTADPTNDARLNIALTLDLARKSLVHHKMIALVTIFGIALGVAVVGAILIVDENTIHDAAAYGEEISDSAALDPTLPLRDPTFVVAFERAADAATDKTGVVPTQRGQSRPLTPDERGPAARRGEEDYQAMRLAVRLASLLALFVGALIVFYTMRYSVAGRAKEFCLLLCLGERRANVGLSLIIEALLLGGAGTLLGLAMSFLIASHLLDLGISTNGRVPMSGFAVPTGELVAMSAISIFIVMIGVLSSIHAIYKLSIAEVLGPRLLARDIGERALTAPALTWLIPPFLAAAYVGLRPFLESWLSVVYFFVFESLFVAVIAIAILWWLGPVLRGMLRIFEIFLQPLLPLEVFLTSRRLRLSGRGILFPLVGVTLVFSLVTGLHDITRSLKDEIRDWAAVALQPYSYFELARPAAFGEAAFQVALEREQIHIFRLSRKLPGEFPVRLVLGQDINRYRALDGREPLVPGTVILSRTLAARFSLAAHDTVIIQDDYGTQRFTVIEVSDEVGFFIGSGQYVDLKSYALFSDGNPVFATTLEPSLGQFAMARNADPGGRYLQNHQIEALAPFYRHTMNGRGQGSWQVREIDRDFLIFDFVLFMTIILAGIGVANTMLIQVRAREREFSVLRSIGIGRWQIVRLLVLEGALIGLVGGAIAILLGNILGAISISFLDHFTLFDYRFRFSVSATLWLFGFAVVTCLVSALYPAIAARKVSSAEALHYE
jgi:putative ABC transport system permease protein